MPELPEVETVRRGLKPALAGARLLHVEQRRPDLRFPLPDRFAQRLEGARVQAVERRAKYLLAPLDTGQTWVTHLGMTGRFLVERGAAAETPGVLASPTSPPLVGAAQFTHAAATEAKHAHVVVETDAGARVTFFDARRFGYMGLIPTAELPSHPWFAGLGPEPLGPGFTTAHLHAAFAGRKQAVKTLLLDQRIVAGLGNIYVVEALHRSGIHPEAVAGTLSRPRTARLVEAIRNVLQEAVKAGGSTIRDYADAEGLSGLFQHSWAVYGREEAPCIRPRCTGAVRRVVQGGRSTFFCPRCQR